MRFLIFTISSSIPVFSVTAEVSAGSVIAVTAEAAENAVIAEDAVIVSKSHILDNTQIYPCFVSLREREFEGGGVRNFFILSEGGGYVTFFTPMGGGVR